MRCRKSVRCTSVTHSTHTSCYCVCVCACACVCLYLCVCACAWPVWDNPRATWVVNGTEANRIHGTNGDQFRYPLKYGDVIPAFVDTLYRHGGSLLSIRVRLCSHLCIFVCV